MKYMTDKLLSETYVKAVLLGVDCEFIQLLEREIKRRNISIEDLFEEKNNED
ncbi:sporulation histidine kinase inhibitor Sda [Halalkalibacter urbisdiaboli]|uniref:sporulation histidine kinase inhibitor Sda n=1 Tax=Halalkalibacter urbisdiaboli TaxID=1960589 RepID=UPI000B4451EE|nr:sporulation histidine kinase inhibitor Sda [Halalkalibacter urbisdiaboli]